MIVHLQSKLQLSVEQRMYLYTLPAVIYPETKQLAAFTSVYFLRGLAASTRGPVSEED